MIRILHLSDFHFTEKTRWESEAILHKLVVAMAEEHKRQAIDVVVVTGDIAFSGKAAEYALAHEFFAIQLLPALGLDKTRILFVPGNHDVDRSQVDFMVESTQTALLAPYQPDRQAIAKVLGQDSPQKMMLARFKCYQAFVAKFQKRQLPWWRQIIEIGDQRIGFGGLCSAWMCHKDNEQGTLLLGHYQIEQVLKGLRDVPLKIALLHHPEVYMKAGEDSWSKLRSEFQLILSGHMHQTRMSKIEENGGTCLQLAAGACYEKGTYANAFQIIQLDLTAQRVLVEPWLWQDHKWIPDFNRRHGGFSLRAPGKEDQAQSSLTDYVQRYRRAFADRFSRWDLGQIGQAYNREERLNTASLDTMYLALRLARGYDPTKTNRGNLLDAKGVTELNQSLVIRGIPGSGKTTWCRYTFRRLLQCEGVLPLFLELRSLSGYWANQRKQKVSLDLLAYLQAEIERDTPTLSGFPLKTLLSTEQTTRIVLLVDGWDEIGSDGDELRELLHRLKNSCDRLTIIATSRPFGQGQPSHADGYKTLDIQPLSDEDIAQLASRFFQLCHGESVTANREQQVFMQNLTAAPGAAALARTPLLLTMMMFISRTQVLPDKRHKLYKICVENLLQDLPDQQKEKGVVQHDQHWRPDEGEERLRWVAELAYKLQTAEGERKKTVVLPRPRLTDFLAKLPENQRDKFLNWLVDRAGLMVERSDGTLTFMAMRTAPKTGCTSLQWWRQKVACLPNYLRG